MTVVARVLVVEDDAVQAHVLAQVLTAHGFYVDVAATGLEAIRTMLAGWFDVVVMDYVIPDLDGLAVGRVIAELTRIQGRPRLIALTTSPGRLTQREEGAPSVFDAVELKPWAPESLVETIKRCHAAAPPAAYRQVQPANPGPGRAKGPLGTGRQRILVADDDAGLRTILASALADLGFAVEEAENGLDALRKVVAQPYDAVVIDYHMPEIDGLAAGRLIHQLVDRATRPRLIALTAAPDSLTDHEHGHLSVFDDIIAKDKGLASLLAAVQQSVEYHSLRAGPEQREIVGLSSILRLAADDHAGAVPSPMTA